MANKIAECSLISPFIVQEAEVETKNKNASVTGRKIRLARKKAVTKKLETRAGLAKARMELENLRIELAEIRIESARVRTELAEIRAMQAETMLKRMIHKEVNLRQAISARLVKNIIANEIVGRKSPLEQLTGRQREILQLIAEGRNTKQIGVILKVSPKTVEYHRLKLMNCLKVHDIPGLVRFALRVGLVAH